MKSLSHCALLFSCMSRTQSCVQHTHRQLPSPDIISFGRDLLNLFFEFVPFVSQRLQDYDCYDILLLVQGLNLLRLLEQYFLLRLSSCSLQSQKHVHHTHPGVIMHISLQRERSRKFRLQKQKRECIAR